MEKHEVVNEVSKVLIDILGIEKDEITESANFMNDLGCDSLTLSEIILELENLFNLTIADDESEKIKTVGDAIACIEKKLNERKTTAA